MKFVIRDDDACAFTPLKLIQSCYQDIWNDVPISLSMTPFRIPGNDRHAPTALNGDMEVMPLEANTELVSFVREAIAKHQIDVTLHGYHHLPQKGLPEFIAGENLATKAKEGRAYLERLFDIDVCTFVPPNNGIGRVGLQAIIKAGMNLAGVPTLWSPAARSVNARSLALIPRTLWHHRVKHHCYPHILDFGDHKEIYCHTVGPRSYRSRLVRELEYCQQAAGVFVLATHYHAFARTTQDGFSIGKVVYELVDRAMRHPATHFVGFNSIW